ncbi:hypothetical protein SDC9_180451 [bioreactor metagenome]|uniref:Uncharacterized protein n=1 Tax=bioreactor metagenome TaxID=1076179 RepID=A0A645H1T8_9ZZZZ
MSVILIATRINQLISGDIRIVLFPYDTGYIVYAFFNALDYVTGSEASQVFSLGSYLI